MADARLAQIDKEVAARLQEARQIRRLVDLNRDADRLIADATAQPHKIYLWLPVSKPGNPFHPEEKLVKFFGGCIVEPQGYFSATAIWPDGEWEIDTEVLRFGNQMPDDVKLRTFFNVTDITAWQMKGGCIDTSYMHSPPRDVLLDKISDVHSRYDVDEDIEYDQGRCYVRAMWLTQLPGANKVGLLAFDQS